MRTLAAGGHDVLFTYRTDQPGAQALAAEVAEESGRAIDITRLDQDPVLTVTNDVRQPSDVRGDHG